MKGRVLLATLFKVIVAGCCKIMINKRDTSKHIRQEPSSNKDDSKEEQSGDWCNIPTNVLELILKRLSRADFYRFGQVCISWRHVVTESIIYRSASPLPSMPLLLVYQLSILNDVKAGFFSLKERKMYYPKKPLFKRNVHCIGSITGWLIMVDVTQKNDQTQSFFISSNNKPSSFFFWNPISDAKIMLPTKLNIPYPVNWYKLFSKVKALSRPDCPDCIVVGLFSGRHHIAFGRPNDESWSIISVENNVMNTVFCDIELLHGKCYVLTETITSRKVQSILVYDLQVPSPMEVKVLISLEEQPYFFPRDSTRMSLGYRNLNYQNQVFYYLASDPASGDLYLIFMIADNAIYLQPEGQKNNAKFTSPFIEKEFIVYKVDLCNQPQLVKAQSLKDGILFLSHKGSIIVPSSALSGPDDLIRGNTIYFARAYPCDENPLPAPQIVKFSMADERINNICMSNLELDVEPTCLWFTPTLW